MAERFPRAYVQSAKKDSIMEYVPFETLDIGARQSGLPKNVKATTLGLEHVGMNASNGGGSR